MILTNGVNFATGPSPNPPSNKYAKTHQSPLIHRKTYNNTMVKPLSFNIIVVFPFNLVDYITIELAFGDIRKLQEQLAVNAQAVRSPCIQIFHATLVYYIPIYMQYNQFSWNPTITGTSCDMFYLLYSDKR